MRITPAEFGFGELVAQVGQRIRFAVRLRAECGADSGPQVRGYQAFPDECGMQPGDFGDQVDKVIDQAGKGRLALLADLHSCEFECDRGEDFVKVDLELGDVRLVLWRAGHKAPPP